MREMKDLVELAHFLGSRKDILLASNGTLSYKNDRFMWINAKSIALEALNENQFVILEREKLKRMVFVDYSQDPIDRERAVQIDLLKARSHPELMLQPSTETIIHEVIRYDCIAHVHPAVVNGLLSGLNAKQLITEMFGEEALFIPFVNPGYSLAKIIHKEVKEYEKAYQRQPEIIFVQNQGVIVSGDDAGKVKQILERVMAIVTSWAGDFDQKEDKLFPGDLKTFMPALRMIFSDDHVKIVKSRYNSLIEKYCKDKEAFADVVNPLTIQQVLCASPMPFFIEKKDQEVMIGEIKKKAGDYQKKYAGENVIIGIQDYGIVAVGNSAREASLALDVFEESMVISELAARAGGVKPIDDFAIDFILATRNRYFDPVNSFLLDDNSGVSGKVAIVTGGAQGFGGGIVERFFDDGMNVVIADLNVEKGIALQNELNAHGKKNQTLFVETNVADGDSVSSLISETIRCFGGLDVFISNAGVLKAGGLDEIDEQTFAFLTDVNYKGYFICAKYASEVMKIQYQYKDDHYMDIIQVNSKSGLKGSNKNFAYAGGKFGGIGLTQSFAMELMPYNIKVNSICPGNFFEGPLWSDPENGLFVQYLKAGKVPGAKTIDDVKTFYESQVPAGRGCRVDDVAKAIYYAMGQIYETGQAIPVTGGQIMLK